MIDKLAGRRILLVEDEILIAMLLEDAFTDVGCTIVGPFGRLADALRAAQSDGIDGAVLDVNVAGEKVFPVAELLAGRRVPFLLLSGYGDQAAPADRPGWQVCAKPFNVADVLARLAGLMAAA